MNKVELLYNGAFMQPKHFFVVASSIAFYRGKSDEASLATNQLFTVATL